MVQNIVGEQISSHSFENKTTYKSYVWPFNCVQTNELWLI